MSGVLSCPEPLVPSEARRALIFGRAQGVFEEIEAAKALCQFDVIIAVKRIGIEYPGPVDHWVSWHAELFPNFIELRRRAGHPDAATYWTGKTKGHKQGNGVKLPLRHAECDGGSSGLLAALVAVRELNIGKSVLAGIPMDADRGRYDKPGVWKDAPKFHEAWLQALPALQGRVRSMSGWTMQLLGGPPSQAWLAEPIDEAA